MANYRNRNQYQSVIGHRHWLQAQGEPGLSVADYTGSKVAILVPFVEEVIRDGRDSRVNFERQTKVLTERYKRRERDPFHIMGATPDDFLAILTDRTVPTVVVAGTGTISSVLVPLSRDRDQDPRIGYLDWLHLAGMANHLKLGQFVMLQCGRYKAGLNVPLGVGVVKSHADIFGALGRSRFTTDVDFVEAPVVPITTEPELSYEYITDEFRVERNRNVPDVVPDTAFVVIRDFWNHRFNPDRGEFIQTTDITRPDLRQYLEFV